MCYTNKSYKKYIKDKTITIYKFNEGSIWSKECILLEEAILKEKKNEKNNS